MDVQPHEEDAPRLLPGGSAGTAILLSVSALTGRTVDATSHEESHLYSLVRSSPLILGPLLCLLMLLGCSNGDKSALSHSELSPTASGAIGSVIEEGVCPVTQPNGLTYPGQRPSPGSHGNGKLWTILWPEGRVIFTDGGPGGIEPDGSLTMKWGWWRSVAGHLEIDGRKSDGSPGVLRATITKGYGETGFQATYLTFSSTGCWEVTARVGSESLSFVTEVVRR